MLAWRCRVAAGRRGRCSRIAGRGSLAVAGGFLWALVSLGVAVAAGPQLFGLGGSAGTVAPNCPGAPCVVVTAATGFQAAIGGRHNTMTVGRAGRVTSWKIVLAAPTPAQVAYFDQLVHGPARAGLVVLRHVVDYGFRVIDASPLVMLAPFFGRAMTFDLTRPLPVRRGDILALTVPTWAPALAAGLDPNTAWRASRPRTACSDVLTPTAQTTYGALTQYECVYPAVRLAYGATVTDGPATAPTTAAPTPATPPPAISLPVLPPAG